MLPNQEWVNDYIIVDYEYWPYADGNQSYPNDIGWGYFAGRPEEVDQRDPARRTAQTMGVGA